LLWSAGPGLWAVAATAHPASTTSANSVVRFILHPPQFVGALLDARFFELDPHQGKMEANAGVDAAIPSSRYEFGVYPGEGE
jgi:hypothetical protein